MTLVQYLDSNNMDCITNDAEFCEAEHDAIVEYFQSYEYTEDDIKEAEARGYDVSYFIPQAEDESTMIKGNNVLIHYPTLNKLATFYEYTNGTYFFKDHSGLFGVTEKYKQDNNIQFEVIAEG